VHYSIQRDHVHLLVEADDARALGRGMMAIGSRIARAMNRVCGRAGAVLADHYHLRVLRTAREVRHAIAYVLHNARKHAIGRGRSVASTLLHIDPASSGRRFRGWRERQPRAPDAPAVATPRTWLLRVGWMRHGAISVEEAQGARRGRRL
jgi:hypothetical protein